MDVYKNAGAAVRLFRAVTSRMIYDISPVINKREMDGLLIAIEQTETAIRHAHWRMTDDHKDLDDEGKNIFYGAINEKKENDLDGEMKEMIEALAKDIFNEVDP